MMNSSDVTKAVGLPETIDSSHAYGYRSGDHGIYAYWYKDRAENYWKYTNAPEGNPQFDPHGGPALLDPDQPMPHTAPEFYTPDGRKLHVAVPQGVPTEVNPGYDPNSSRNIWYELYRTSEGNMQYVYLDTDIRENLDLFVQHQLRIADAGLVLFRQMAANLFAKVHPKDRITGMVMMLVDQGFFNLDELAQATVADVDFVDETVRLLGRKLICDSSILDFITSLVGSRDLSAPLFTIDTVHGSNHLGVKYLASVFSSLKVSPVFLLYWHANETFSRIMTRLSLQQVPLEQVEEMALGELAKVLNTREDVQHLVDFKLKRSLLEGYTAHVGKSLERLSTDEWGVSKIWSDLVEMSGPEQEFSGWLHNEPMHDVTPEEEAQMQDAMAQQAAAN